MEILNAQQMTEADRYTIDTLGIPSIVLMENASKSVFDVFESLETDAEQIAVVIGSGNNGGDGLTLARILINNDYDVDIFLAADPAKLKGDALINYQILCNYNVPFIHLFHGEAPDFSLYDVIFDAIFGTGLSRTVSGHYADIIKSINDTDGIRIAIDIPSGLNGNSGNLIGSAVEADVTVTFCRPKIPHCIYPAKKYCGLIHVTDISIPDIAVEQQQSNIYLIHDDNLPYIEYRTADSHKGSYGHAVIVGGSTGKSGAITMTAKACTRVGAGLTTAIIPKGINVAFESHFLEGMSLPMSDENHLTPADLDKTIVFLNDKSVCAIGPGLGQSVDTELFLKALIHKTSLPLIIDADGVNGLTLDNLADLKDRAILTPHLGEFARLIGVTVEDLKADRLTYLSEFAKKHQLYVVLKSADTLIGAPDGSIYVSHFGTAALAKGGSGDCLTGIITGFISQGYDMLTACILGPVILGKTAEILTESTHINSITTNDIIEQLWKALNELTKNR